MPMDHNTPSPDRKAAVASRDLALTGADGTARVITTADLKALPHITVTVTNGHSHKQESYSGVPVLDVLKLVPAMHTNGKAQPLTTVVVAEGTDGYRVAISLCDVDPGCRSGQAIVADAQNGQPLTTTGLFQLILTEDKMPKRWVHNLSALTEQTVHP